MFEWLASVRRLASGERLRHPIPPLDGAFSPNDRLDELTPLGAVFDQPDEVISDRAGGLLVSAGNTLWSLDMTGKSRPVATFDSPISALARWRDGHVAVALDGGRLVRLDEQGQVEAEAAGVVGLPLSGITALTSSGDDGLYFTIGSTRHPAADWVRDLMDRNQNGQIGYWPLGGSPRLLLDGLSYPTGLCLSQDGKRLLVSESWAHSLKRFPIGSEGLGSPETLIDNLPGYPSRICSSQDGGYWLAVFALRTQLVELVLREKAFRLDMTQSLEPDLWIRPALASTGSHLEPLQIGGIKRLAISKPWAPPRSYGLVLRLDTDGEVIDSMHSRAAGRYHGVTAVREIGRHLYIVSHGNGRVLVMPIHVGPDAEVQS